MDSRFHVKSLLTNSKGFAPPSLVGDALERTPFHRGKVLTHIAVTPIPCGDFSGKLHESQDWNNSNKKLFCWLIIITLVLTYWCSVLNTQRSSHNDNFLFGRWQDNLVSWERQHPLVMTKSAWLHDCLESGYQYNVIYIWLELGHLCVCRCPTPSWCVRSSTGTVLTKTLRMFCMECLSVIRRRHSKRSTRSRDISRYFEY